MYLSLQRAEAFSSLARFATTLISEAAAASGLRANLSRPPEDLPSFERALETLNDALGDASRKVLLCLDEYENLDVKLGEGVFPHDLLAVLRQSIQFHRNLVWLFAGSHEISELRHGAWTSHLVSVRTVEVPRFTLEEVRTLLSDPMHHSSAWAHGSAQRPQLAGFWGRDSIERIHAESGGWPHLVQLVAQECVSQANRTRRPKLDDDLLEQSLASAIVAGHNVLYELLNNESERREEWDYLSGFARQSQQPIPRDDRLRRALVRRRLVVTSEGNMQLVASIMARWLRERGDLPWHGEGHRPE